MKKEEILSLFTKKHFVAQVFEKHPGIIVILDYKKKIKYINQNFLNLTGYKEEEIIEKNFFDIFVEKEERVEEYFEKIISKQAQNPYHHINKIIKKDGSKSIIMWTNFYIEDDNKVTGTISFGYDITFRAEYINDIEKINILVKNLGIDSEENIKKIIKFARELSGAKFCSLNIYKEDGTIKPFYIYGIDENIQPEKIEKTLCGKVLLNDLFDKEIKIDFEDEFLKKHNIVKYYGITVDRKNKTGILCFFYDNDIHIKKERLSIVAKIVENEYRRYIYEKHIIGEKERFFNLLNYLPVGFIYYDFIQRNIEFYNNKLLEITGYSDNEIKDKNVDFLKDMIIDKDVITDYVLNPNKYPSGVDVRGRSKNGELRILHYNLGPFIEKNKVLLIFNDVTDERKKEEKLRLFKEIDDILIKNSGEKLYQYLVDFFRKKFNCEYGVIGFLENDMLEIKYMSDNVYEKCKIGDKIYVKRYIDSNYIWVKSIRDGSINFINEPKDIEGHIPIKNAASFPVRFGEKIVGVFMFANKKEPWTEDDLKKLEEFLNYTAQRIFYIYENEKIVIEKAEETFKSSYNEALITFTAGIAHNLNNMLVPVFSNFSILKEKNKEKECDEIYIEFEEYLKSIKEIVQELLNISNPSAVAREYIKISEIVRLIEFIAKGFNLDILINKDKELCDKYIFISYSQINQVISNIIKNASEVMEGKKIKKVEVGLSLKKVGEKDFVFISIKDFGPGIKKEDRDRIFNIYFTTKKTGKGFGLFMCKRILENCGGGIRFETEEGKGTEFIFWLPLYEKNEEAVKNIVFDNNAIKSISVLIIDDEDYVIRSLTRLLKYLGVEKVFSTTNSKQAFEIVEKEKIDIVFIDFILKEELDGTQINLKIKEKYPNIFTVISTGYTDVNVLNNLELYKFDLVLLKPYKLYDIRKVLENFLNYKYKNS